MQIDRLVLNGETVIEPANPEHTELVGWLIKITSPSQIPYVNVWCKQHCLMLEFTVLGDSGKVVVWAMGEALLEPDDSLFVSDVDAEMCVLEGYREHCTYQLRWNDTENGAKSYLDMFKEGGIAALSPFLAIAEKGGVFMVDEFPT